MPVILLLVLLALFHQQIQMVQTQSNSTVALPLAMRSPFLSCWLPQINGFSVANATDYYFPSTPSTPQGRKWRVYVRIDGNIYGILGSAWPIDTLVYSNATALPIHTANITSTVVTPTRTILTAAAGPMQVNLTFMNPVEPGDWVKQSIPFTYLSLTARSLDNSSHAMQVLSDINGSTKVVLRSPFYPLTTTAVWISNPSMPIYWNVTSSSALIYHAIRSWVPVSGSEGVEGTGRGTLYYAMKAGSGVTYAVRDEPLVWFYESGDLGNQEIQSDYPRTAGNTSFAISRDLGTIQATQAPVVWAIGYTMDPVINYTVQVGSSSGSARSPYYKLQYADDISLIVDLLDDFVDATIRAQQLDQRILQDAASVSDLLGDLVSLAVPQVFGSTQLTIGTDSNGNFNKSDVMMFMKNVGGEISGRINAVETLYAAFPALMYIDPSLGTPLLEPLFQLQASPGHGVKFAPKDLGSSYPIISTGQSTYDQGVEQTGNMLIMTYANARANGDVSLVNRYYSVLASWADYLSNSSLNTADQLDVDHLGESASPNNKTNLAIKGIIAIGAMSNMSLAAGNIADADKYSGITARLYTQWKTVALGSDQHLFAVENKPDSWTLGYNLFADVWLGTKVIESSVYDGQSNFLINIPSVDNETGFGFPVENDNSDFFTTISSWNLFVAAMTPNNNLRSGLIGRVHNRASLSVNQKFGAFPLRYDSRDGSDISGMGSPAQGAMFAPMYEKIPVRHTQFNATTTTPPRKTSKPLHVNGVGRAIIGTLAALVVAAMAILYRWRLRIRKFSPSSSATIPRIAGRNPQSGLPGTVTANTDAHSLLSSTSPSDQSSPTVPLGLSAKELARMRAEASRSQPDVTSPVVPVDSVLQSLPSPVVATESNATTSSSPFRAVQSQFDRILREIQQLQVRAERSDAGAPPSYRDEEPGTHQSGGMGS